MDTLFLASTSSRKTNIVVLDGHTLNPGDLDWTPLQALGNCVIYPRTVGPEVRERAIGAEFLLTNKTVIDRATIEGLPRLKYIGVLATGYNVVDVQAARERGVIVTNVPDYGTASVAQATFALLLELTNHVGHLAGTVREGRWVSSPDFSYWDKAPVELKGLTMGIIGFGRIGQGVARLAQAFGMNVLFHSRSPRELAGATWADLDTLFSASDVVSLHCPLTPETQGIIDAHRLGQMKPSALLLNTARGPLVQEAALAEALHARRIGGAGLDVLSREPPTADNPLLTAPNCLITPHVAWAAHAARRRLLDTVVGNIRAFQEGHPIHIVSPSP